MVRDQMVSDPDHLVQDVPKYIESYWDPDPKIILILVYCVKGHQIVYIRLFDSE